MIPLSEIQSLILSRAAARPGNLALPLPDGLRGGAAAKVVEALLAKGLVEEVEANIRRSEPLWRETGDGHGTTLLATEAGLCAVGIEPLVAGAVAGARRGRMERDAIEPTASAAASASPAIRADTKQAALIALLQRPEGASVAEAAAAFSWQPHTVRGAISGALKKRLGLVIAAEKIDGRGTVYRIATEG
ncbi:Protein of unknown function [Paracoccus aminovorans]|uniref:DUF3489 domain-containing protein n=1 Tax=Paracoccus aminovorans TaxID=34004 RepID=A0A1I3DB88_9RHOB|nr:DUF3489 domain-containing protein [Paracoccus aminovorans]CQR84713.1 hypothetical protein JCM7685_0120 [Paracoccus aminovorans]SFH83985.1 Protein of unknown function [Paracoccus aminovorans]